MEKIRRNKLMLRWSILTAAAIALFWAIWHLANGSVPEVSSVKISKTRIIEFGFGISRWWDILIGPIWSVSIINIIYTLLKKNNKNDNIVYLINGLSLGLVFGLIIGLGFGLSVGLGFSLCLGLVISLCFGLIIGLDYFDWGFDLNAGLGFGLGANLGISLGAGLGFGLGVGLGFGLGVGLAFGLGFSLVGGLKKIPWRVIKKFLLAND